MTYYCLPVPKPKQFSCWKLWWKNLHVWVCASMPVKLWFWLMKLSHRAVWFWRIRRQLLWKPTMSDTNGWGVFCQLAPMGGQLWTSPFIYKRPQGRSLPTNRFSVTRRFALQFGFVSLTGSLHLLPFLLLAIEQSGWAICINWMLLSAKCCVWSSGPQILWNGTRLGMIFCIIGMGRQ